MASTRRDDLLRALPYARRYARALTGSQPRGDLLVAEGLREMLAATETTMSPRHGLYHWVTRRFDEGVLNALDHGLTEVTLWGEHCPAELDSTVGWVRHHLSAAARAFKAQALAAIEPVVANGTIGDAEIFRCGMMIRPSVAADLIPAS